MNSIRTDFPLLSRRIRDREIVYLDNAATTQKPLPVLHAVENYYREHNANVHRAAHVLAGEATEMFEAARQGVASFINASSKQEIIFTRGTTEAINLVANCIDGALKPPLKPGDEILITELEHHSNIVPWQMLAARTGATLKAVKVTSTGDIDREDFSASLSERTRLFACNHVSNALGSINPVAELVAEAKSYGAALHEVIDVQAIDCDFYAISGHKMYAPTGIGALFGRFTLLESMPPWHGGGEMIEHVTIAQSTYQDPPFKFEAGTPNIAGVIGLGAAIDYLQQIPRKALVEAENGLIKYAISRLQQMPEITLVGTPAERSAVISFVVKGSHPHDIGTLLDQQGIAVRTGHHCAMPLMQSLGISGTVRASFSLYNNQEDADRFLEGLEKALTFL